MSLRFSDPLDFDVHHQSAAAVLLGVVVRGVMPDVAVDHPLGRLERRPDHVPRGLCRGRYLTAAGAVSVVAGTQSETVPSA